MTKEPTTDRVSELPVRRRDAFIGVLAALAASISLLERSPKKGAPSNTMFDIMLNDYRKALEAGRTALNAEAPERESGWQLIETAPRDGRPYIVTDGKRVTIYSNGFMPHNEGSLVFIYGNPTHWMPLPKPATNDIEDHQPNKE